jgi:predicted flap endonuclease-1-like 5' DNA nuclease
VKHSWIILGMFLLLIASVGILIYLLAQVAMSVPLALLLWALVFGIFALVGGIAWLAGWLPRKKIPEPKSQSVVIETPKVEPSHLKEEEVKTEPSQKLVEEIGDRGSKIIDIEGIGPVYAKKLNSVDIFTTSDLLEVGGTPRGRKELAEKTGISDKLILRWINMADLFRIGGVGEEYSDLLEMAGVDTVVELAKRVPENLHAKMLEVNEKKNLVRRPPALNEVKQWIEEAKKLPRKIEY